MTRCIYVRASSLDLAAPGNRAVIMARAKEAGVQGIALEPSGAWGSHEGEETIRRVIAVTGIDPTTCVKGILSSLIKDLFK